MLGVETRATVQSTSTVQVLYKTIFARAITWSRTTSRSRPWDCLPRPLKRWGLGMRRRARKGYVAIPIRLPTGELTGYIGITEGKVPKEFHFSNVVTFPKRRVPKKSPPRTYAAFSLLFKARTGARGRERRTARRSVGAECVP
jgi:hypothetical protein